MRVLVTGHKGYIGTALVPMLLDNGHDVLGLDTDLYRACTYTGSMVDVPSLVVDVREIEPQHVQGCDAVIHLAALSNDPLGSLNPRITREINEQASVRLARLSRDAGSRRFLFASSCSVYGAAGSDFVAEQSPFRPVTPYGESKANVEKKVRQLASARFSPTFLRASTAYGVSPRIRFDLVLNNLTAWAVTTRKIVLKSDGTPWRPLVHVEDIARAYLAILESPRQHVHNRSFNVGTTAENYQIRDLADIVKNVVPNCQIEYADNAGPDTRCYRVDCNEIARTIPGFKPQWTARRGAIQLFDTLTRVGLSSETFEGSQFSRIAHIRHLMAVGDLDENLRWRTATTL